MKIKREVEMKEAKYDITELTHEEFITIVKAMEYYSDYRRHDRNDPLYLKLRQMADSSITII